ASTTYGNAPGLYETVDGGRHWQRVRLTLASNLISAVRFDQSPGRTIYVATLDRGVFMSDDRGAHWRALDEDRPDSAFTDLAVDATGTFLYASTDSGLYTYEIRARRRRAVQP